MIASRLLTVVAVALFVLAALNIAFGAEDHAEMIAWGLAAFALAHLVP